MSLQCVITPNQRWISFLMVVSVRLISTRVAVILVKCWRKRLLFRCWRPPGKAMFLLKFRDYNLLLNGLEVTYEQFFPSAIQPFCRAVIAVSWYYKQWARLFEALILPVLKRLLWLHKTLVLLQVRLPCQCRAGVFPLDSDFLCGFLLCFL